MRKLLIAATATLFAVAAASSLVAPDDGPLGPATRVPEHASALHRSAAVNASGNVLAADYALSAPNSIALGSPSYAVAVGDVTGDFRDDIVVVTRDTYPATAPGAVQIFEQRMDGTLGSPRRISPSWGSTSHVEDVALGDLNGDGTLDIALADGSRIALLMADGLGGFAERVVSNGMYGCDDIAVAQLDTQGTGSLADVVCFADYGGMRVHFDPADARSYRAFNLPGGSNRGSAVQVQTVDVTGDGRPDILSGESKSYGFDVQVNEGGRTFRAPRGYTLPGPYRGIASGDVDGDGLADVVSTYGSVYGATSRADDPLALRETIALQSWAKALAIADLDRNGRRDLLALYATAGGAEGSLGRMLNSYSAGFLPQTFTAHPDPTSSTWNSLATGDINGDGCTDVAAVTGTNLVLSYGTECVRPAPIAAIAHSAGRIDGDATADLTWFRDSDDVGTQWYLRGGGIDYLAGVCCSYPGMRASAFGDFDGDGRIELVLAGREGVWAAGLRAPYPVGWTVVGAGDVDGDGFDDLVWYHPPTRAIYIWLIDGRFNGEGLRGGRGGMAAPPGLPPVAVADFNGDGRADILLGNTTELWLYQSTPVQTFSSERVSSTPYGWTLRAIGDLDGDQRTDLLWHQPGTGELYMWAMAGARPLRGAAMPSAPTGAAPADIADFDGNGLNDILLMNSSDIWIYQQREPGRFESRYLTAYPKGWHLMKPYTSP